MGLAEPKRKVKYSIDPNALNWANSDSKFGARLMEKMGWEKGKGLGAKENGITEHIKVKFKSDSKGIGYNNNDYDNVWLDHQDDFEAVLSNLNKDVKKPPAETTTNQDEEATISKINTLEEKSKQRGRLHYSKFAKSKDLSRASKDDLESILGKQKRTKLSAAAKEGVEEDYETGGEMSFKRKFNDEENLSESEADLARPSFKLDSSLAKTSDKNDEQNGVQFSTNPMSIKDYFAKKMYKQFASASPKRDEEDEQVKVELDEANEEKKSKKKKKKSKKEIEPEENEAPIQKVEEIIDNEAQNQIETEEPVKEKKKKKKKSEEDKIEPIVEIKETEDEIEDSFKRKKKSKKELTVTHDEKDEENKRVVEKESVKMEESEQVDFEYNETSKTKKKKKKKEVELRREAVETETGETSVEVQRVVEEEAPVVAETTKYRDAFAGSNLFDIYGYSPYNVSNSNLKAILIEKEKKTNKKRAHVERNLLIDENFYKNSKKAFVA